MSGAFVVVGVAGDGTATSFKGVPRDEARDDAALADDAAVVAEAIASFVV